jgi:hypothetical protein
MEPAGVKDVCSDESLAITGLRPLDVLAVQRALGVVNEDELLDVASCVLDDGAIVSYFKE